MVVLFFSSLNFLSLLTEGRAVSTEFLYYGDFSCLTGKLRIAAKLLL